MITLLTQDIRDIGAGQFNAVANDLNMIEVKVAGPVANVQPEVDSLCFEKRANTDSVFALSVEPISSDRFCA